MVATATTPILGVNEQQYLEKVPPNVVAARRCKLNECAFPEPCPRITINTIDLTPLIDYESKFDLKCHRTIVSSPMRIFTAGHYRMALCQSFFNLQVVKSKQRTVETKEQKT